MNSRVYNADLLEFLIAEEWKKLEFPKERPMMYTRTPHSNGQFNKLDLYATNLSPEETAQQFVEYFYHKYYVEDTSYHGYKPCVRLFPIRESKFPIRKFDLRPYIKCKYVGIPYERLLWGTVKAEMYYSVTYSNCSVDTLAYWKYVEEGYRYSSYEEEKFRERCFT